MTRDDLASAGECIYGARWQTALARALGVNDRTVRRWLSGEQVVPGPVAVAIDGLLRSRRPAMKETR